MSKNSFLKVKDLKEAFINTFKIFLLSLILSFSILTPLYIFHIEIFDTLSLLKMTSITGIRSVFLYLVIILAIRIFKGKPKKIKIDRL